MTSTTPSFTLPAFESLLPTIEALPLDRELTRRELLVDALRLHRDRDVEVYFMPTDGLRPRAKLLLLGITPGWTQMELAYRHIRRSLHDGIDASEARRRARYAASFGGPMRKNLVSMLDDLGLAASLGVPSAEALFDHERDHVHATSILRHPVFVGGRNFTGHERVVTRSPIAADLITHVFLPELAALPDALIVPMGDYVADRLHELSAAGLVDPDRCLLGFPHPSGANGHRKGRFAANRAALAKKAEAWLSRGAGPTRAAR